MEITIIQKRLAKALSIMSRVALNSRTGLPILNNVLLRAEGNQLTLTATNLELATVSYLTAKVEKEGTITVPARLMAEFVANLPKDDDVNISTKDGKMTVSAGKYKSTINGIAADDFPELPKIDEKKAVQFRVGVDVLKESINEVSVAASNDMTRPALTGVYFNTFDGALYMAATDGYRLTDKRFIDEVKSEVKAIVPASALQEVLRSISDDVEEVEIMFDETQVRFLIGDVEVMSKLIDGSFPDYRQLIPKNTEIEVEVDRNELLRMVKVAALFARDSGGSVVCETKSAEGVFSVGAVASELGENKTDLKVEVDSDGKVTVNSRFLMDALNVLLVDKIRFGFSGKLTPVVLRGVGSDNYTHLVMPLRGQ